MNKKELKIIIKECLLEVLREGLDDTATVLETASRAKPKKSAKTQCLERQRLEEQRLANKRKRLEQIEIPQIPGISKELNEAIFADTYETTLSEQFEPGSPSLPGSSPSSTSYSDDGDVETSGGTTWADLAFMPTRTGKNIK